MGLIRSGIQLGGAYAIVNMAIKGLNKKASTENDALPPPGTTSYGQAQPQREPLQRDAQAGGYGHAGYCNGSCGGRCNRAEESGPSTWDGTKAASSTLPSYEQIKY
jgi:hypothetical protein